MYIYSGNVLVVGATQDGKSILHLLMRFETRKLEE